MNLISLGQVFDQSIEHYKKYFHELISLSAWLLVSALPAALAKFLAPFTEVSGQGLNFLVIFLEIIGSFSLIIVGMWILLALIKTVDAEANNTKPDHKKITRESINLLPQFAIVYLLLILITLLISLPILIGFALIWTDVFTMLPGAAANLAPIGGLLLVIGAPFALIMLFKVSLEYGFVSYALALDNAKNIQAFRTSSKLVKGRFWAVALRFFAPKILYSLASYISNAAVKTGLTLLIVFAFGNTLLGHGLGSALLLILTVAITTLLTPLATITDYYIFASLKKTATT